MLLYVTILHMVYHTLQPKNLKNLRIVFFVNHSVYQIPISLSKLVQPNLFLLLNNPHEPSIVLLFFLAQPKFLLLFLDLIPNLQKGTRNFHVTISLSLYLGHVPYHIKHHHLVLLFQNKVRTQNQIMPIYILLLF